MSPPPLSSREQARQRRFDTVWTQQLDKIFVDVAPYYDRANLVASLGLWNWILRRFMATIDVRPGKRVLDVCAGTNAVGIALLRREPSLEVLAIDRSAAMQEVGRARAVAHGFHIQSLIGDVHELPFPDNHFDLITLQWASRHLRIRRVFDEVHRVLRPGGRFYHCDMLRPGNRAVEKLYHAYLRFCLSFTAVLFGSGPTALGARTYFINALEMFYSAGELSEVLRAHGFERVAATTLFAGTLGFHRAAKPA